MGIVSTILGFCGFGVGISIGLLIGYYLFIYFQPTDVKVSFFFLSVIFFSPSYVNLAFVCNLGSFCDPMALFCLDVSFLGSYSVVKWLLANLGVCSFLSFS